MVALPSKPTAISAGTLCSLRPNEKFLGRRVLGEDAEIAKSSEKRDSKLCELCENSAVFGSKCEILGRRVLGEEIANRSK